MIIRLLIVDIKMLKLIKILHFGKNLVMDKLFTANVEDKEVFYKGVKEFDIIQNISKGSENIASLPICEEKND